MRKFLLAGVAFAAAVAAVPSIALAQQSSSPVTVYIGGRLFQGINVAHTTGQNDDGTKVSDENYTNYMRLYPGADYAAPNGLHYGFSAEIRDNSTPEGAAGANTLFWQRAYGYVSGNQFGKFQFGTPVPALEVVEYGVPTDMGTGGFDGDLNNFSAAKGNPDWLFRDVNDTLDGFNYATPSFGGFSAIVGFIPAENHTKQNDQVTSTATGTEKGQLRNETEGAFAYNGTIGALGLKAEVGGLYSGYVKDTSVPTQPYQDMAVFDAGVAATFSGLTVAGHVDAGKYNANWAPVAKGAKSTVAYGAEVVYGLPDPAVPLTVGVGYYGYTIDGNSYDSTLVVGRAVKFNGGNFGASYKLVPGVTLFLEGLLGVQKFPAADYTTGLEHKSVTASTLGVGTYFQW